MWGIIMYNKNKILITFVSVLLLIVSLNGVLGFTYDCNPYQCNPHQVAYQCNPHQENYACNPYDCSQSACNSNHYCNSGSCEWWGGAVVCTCYDTCTRTVWDTCYRTEYDTCYNTCYSPEAFDVNDTTLINTPVTLTLSCSDNDTLPGSLTYIKASNPSNGNVGSISGNQITYTPTTGFTGIDSFTYKCSDENSVESNTATATITVSSAPNNEPPVAYNINDTTPINTPVTLTLSCSDNDTLSGSLTYIKASNPSNGNVGSISGNQITYTPYNNYIGTDSFTYKCNDGSSDSNIATATIIIGSGNCVNNDDCNHLDRDYCTGDIIIHEEGICTNNICQAQIMNTFDCNIYNQDICNASLIQHNDYTCSNAMCVIDTTTIIYNCDILDYTHCDGTGIVFDDYTCNNAACSLWSTVPIQECDNGLYCDGQEYCSNAQCYNGTDVNCNDGQYCTVNDVCNETTDSCQYDARDCSGNDIFGVNTCYNDPDNNPLTFDFRNAFTSTCDETNDLCTSGNDTIEHTCDTNCGAECEIDSDCPDTFCGTDGCYYVNGTAGGPDYYDYTNVSNNCLGDCGCENNSCAAPVITTNDPRCIECTTDDECNHLDRDYCVFDNVTHEEGICVNNFCEANTTTIEDCSTKNGIIGQCGLLDWGCSEELNAVHCTIIDIIDNNTMCDNGLYCDGDEICFNSQCYPGTNVDCSANDIAPIFTCNNTPDSNPFTLDVFGGFNSVCIEATDSCSNGTVNLTHTCNTACGAECEIDSDCPDTFCGTDQCIGNDWYDYTDVPNACTGACSCENNSCTAPNITYNDPRCFGCIIDDDCNYLDDDYCNGTTIMHDEGVCVNTVCQANTTLTQNCDNGLYCDGNETCFNATCQAGTDIDCSGNNISGIGTCTNNPDNNPLTWDFRNAFISTCDETNDQCTTGNYTVVSECNNATCGAECEIDSDCPMHQCGVDGCYGDDYYIFPPPKQEICDSGCSCVLDGPCDPPMIIYNDPRCMNCTTDDDCNYLDDDYCNGTTIMHDEGVCVNTVCQANTTLTQNCDNGLYCDGNETCFNATCQSGTPPTTDDGVVCTNDVCNETTDSIDHNPVDSICDDGAYCNGAEICHLTLGCQSGTDIDCSGNNISGIGTCTNNPDNNLLTWDFRNAFISTCDETNDQCTTGNNTIEHTCDTGCGAECEIDSDCPDTFCGTDQCIGNDWYDYTDVPNACTGACSCENNSCTAPNITYNDPRCTECQIDDDCNNLDNDYCNGTAIMHDEGVCINFVCQTNTTQILDCDNGLYCDGNETCSNAVCILGTAIDCNDGQYCTINDRCDEPTDSCQYDSRDCSVNDIPGIGTCNNDPDNNPFTWDLFGGFTSVCDENNDICTSGVANTSHTCDMAQCNATCETDSDCPDTLYSVGTCLNDCSCDYITTRIEIVSEAFAAFAPADDRFCSDYLYNVDAKYVPLLPGLNNGNIYYYLLMSPSGMTIDTQSGLIFWRPKQTGTYSVQVLATDGTLQDIQSFDLEVKLPAKETEPREKFFIGNIRTNGLVYDELKPGDLLFIDLQFENTGTRRTDEATIRITQSELGISRKLGPFRGPEVQQIMSRGLYLEIPDYAQPGVYTVRISLSDLNGIRRTRHRDFRIV